MSTRVFLDFWVLQINTPRIALPILTSPWSGKSMSPSISPELRGHRHHCFFGFIWLSFGTSTIVIYNANIIGLIWYSVKQWNMAKTQDVWYTEHNIIPHPESLKFPPRWSFICYLFDFCGLFLFKVYGNWITQQIAGKINSSKNKVIQLLTCYGINLLWSYFSDQHGSGDAAPMNQKVQTY